MFLKQAELRKIAIDCAEKVKTLEKNVNFFDIPFKHFYIDNFLPPDLANSCLASFPALDENIWEYANDKDIEVKFRTKWQSEFDIPDDLIYVIRILNSSLFMEAMGEVMGIEKIIPDPYFTGGGLNVTKKGGLLDVHVDGNYHDATGLNRRLNAIIYLNPGWNESWGGEFGVYDEKGEVCIKKIAPIFNRIVVFDSHDKSFHGLPNPINFPESQPRKSILLYYYTKEPRPSDQIIIEQPHSALWKKRHFLDKRGNKTRDYY